MAFLTQMAVQMNAKYNYVHLKLDNYSYNVPVIVVIWSVEADAYPSRRTTTAAAVPAVASLCFSR